MTDLTKLHKILNAAEKARAEDESFGIVRNSTNEDMHYLLDHVTVADICRDAMRWQQWVANHPAPQEVTEMIDAELAKGR